MLTLFSFVMGLIFGFGVYHFFFRLSQPEKALLNQLHSQKAQFKKYKEEVALYLHDGALLMNVMQESCDKFHDRLLKASVELNQQAEKQSILQPSLHVTPHPNLEEEDQVTEYQPLDTPISVGDGHPSKPPKDYA